MYGFCRYVFVPLQCWTSEAKASLLHVGLFVSLGTAAKPSSNLASG